MSLASYKTVLESVTIHEQSAAESSTVMVQKRRSSVVRILPDYIVGPPNLLVLLTVNHVAAELLRLVRTSQSDTVQLPGEGTCRNSRNIEVCLTKVKKNRGGRAHFIASVRPRPRRGYTGLPPGGHTGLESKMMCSAITNA